MSPISVGLSHLTATSASCSGRSKRELNNGGGGGGAAGNGFQAGVGLMSLVHFKEWACHMSLTELSLFTNKSCLSI